MNFGLSRMRNIFSAPETEDQQQKRFLSGVTPFGPKRPDPYSTLFTGEAPSVDTPEMPALDDEQDEQTSNSKYMEELARLQGQTGPALTAYQQAIKQQPTWEQYKPGVGRRIGATIAAGLSGYGGGVQAGLATGEQVLNSGYDRATGEYQRKVKALEDSAKLEEAATRNKVYGLSQARALGLKYDQFNLKKTEVAGKQKVSEQKANTSSDRARAYINAQGKKGYKYINQADGSLLAVNQNDPADKFVVDAKTVAAAQTTINQQNANTAARNASTAASNAGSLADFRKGDLKVRTDKETRLGKTAKTVQPSQQAYARDNALRELATDPRFKDYIVQSDKGTYESTVDDGSRMYQEFKKRLNTLTQASISAGRPFLSDEEDDGDPDITIGAPR